MAECLKLSRDRLARQVSGGGSLVKWEHIPKIVEPHEVDIDLLQQSVLRYGARRGGTSFAQGALRGDYGRDHHGGNFSIWMAGGGVKGGLVYGETDDFSYNIAKNGVHVHDLNATILR